MIMYARDVPLIKAHALSNPDGLVDLVTFVLLTIQQYLLLVPAAFQDVKQFGDQSVRLMGAKRAGYRYAQEHKEVLFAALTKAVEVNDTVGALDILLNVPSLGLVKAGFVAQMLGLDVGCIDSHNLIRLKRIKMGQVKFNKSKTMRPATRDRKIRAYIKLCAKHGGPEKLWNSWCEYIVNPADRKKRDAKGGFFGSFTCASDVSKMHWQAMGLTLPKDVCPF